MLQPLVYHLQLPNPRKIFGIYALCFYSVHVVARSDPDPNPVTAHLNPS